MAKLPLLPRQAIHDTSSQVVIISCIDPPDKVNLHVSACCNRSRIFNEFLLKLFMFNHLKPLAKWWDLDIILLATIKNAVFLQTNIVKLPQLEIGLCRRALDHARKKKQGVDRQSRSPTRPVASLLQCKKATTPELNHRITKQKICLPIQTG